jgi:hypothetical protein
MSDYMLYEASLQHRDVLYYAETAYWLVTVNFMLLIVYIYAILFFTDDLHTSIRVNVDVDVPLFLPLSGQKRLFDLRRTAALEKSSHNSKISGQMNFESGWEFGYHISNAVTARAVWNPLIALDDDWMAFRVSLKSIFSTMFGEFTDKIVESIVHLSSVQEKLLIYGEVKGQPSEDIHKLSGHAYMSGSDTWVDLPRMLGLSFTQPDKIHLHESDDPLWGSMMSLLSEMKVQFAEIDAGFTDIVEKTAPSLSEVCFVVYWQCCREKDSYIFFHFYY